MLHARVEQVAPLRRVGRPEDVASVCTMLARNDYVTGEVVVTIHRRPNEALADLRAHYDDQHIRSEQFLVYKILDAITSTFVPVLTRIDDAIDTLEEQVIEDTGSEQLQRIFSIRRDLVAMRRVITQDL